MNESQIAKIKLFLKDKMMSSAVKEMLRERFLKSKGVTEVNYMAAQRLAIDLLEEGFKELEKLNKDKKEPKIDYQIGL